MSFIDEYCIVFDDEDENKLEFTKIHNVSVGPLLQGHWFLVVFVGFQESC